MSTFMTVFLAFASLLAIVEFYILVRLILRLRATLRRVKEVEERARCLRPALCKCASCGKQLIWEAAGWEHIDGTPYCFSVVAQ